MNKSLAIACLALLLASASAQNATANANATAGTGAAGSFCMTNGDCNQRAGLCCSGFGANSSSPYTQFNCVPHKNGTATVPTQTCLGNGTNGTVIDYNSFCATEDKTCVNSATKFVACGNSIAMFFIDTLNPGAVCTSRSSAMSLATSALFAVLAALALLF